MFAEIRVPLFSSSVRSTLIASHPTLDAHFAVLVALEIVYGACRGS